MPLHVFVRFEPAPGKDHLLETELRGILTPTRAEPGCLRVELFRSVAGPQCFYIHSEWVDQAAFDTHAKMPHMTRFLGLLGELASNAVEAVRTERIG